MEGDDESLSEIDIHPRFWKERKLVNWRTAQLIDECLQMDPKLDCKP